MFRIYDFEFDTEPEAIQALHFLNNDTLYFILELSQESINAELQHNANVFSATM